MSLASYRLFLDQSMIKHIAVYNIKPIINGTEKQNGWANDKRTRLINLIEKHSSEHTVEFLTKIKEKIIHIEDFAWWLYYSGLSDAEFVTFLIQHIDEVSNGEHVYYSTTPIKPINSSAVTTISNDSLVPIRNNSNSVISKSSEVIHESVSKSQSLDCNMETVIINDNDADYLFIICNPSLKIEHVLNSCKVCNVDYVKIENGYKCAIAKSDLERSAFIGAIICQLVELSICVTKAKSNLSAQVFDIYVTMENDELICFTKSQSAYKELSRFGYRKIHMPNTNINQMIEVFNNYKSFISDEAYSYLERNKESTT